MSPAEVKCQRKVKLTDAKFQTQMKEQIRDYLTSKLTSPQNTQHCEDKPSTNDPKYSGR